MSESSIDCRYLISKCSDYYQLISNLVASELLILPKLGHGSTVSSILTVQPELISLNSIAKLHPKARPQLPNQTKNFQLLR